MDTVQNLRQRAYAAGNLRSNDQVQVSSEGQTIVVEPATPEVIYVPYYDPAVVYGLWWRPAYPPMYWAPWPGYASRGFAPGFAWGMGIPLSTGFFFGDFDWHEHRVNVVNVNNYYYNRSLRNGRVARNADAPPEVWRHDSDHRHGVSYREASVRQQYGRASMPPAERLSFRGYSQPSFNDRGASIHRPNARGAPANRPSALENIGHGPDVRNYSSRGRASHGGTFQRKRRISAQQHSGKANGYDRMRQPR